jgi:hypothetical protein
MQETSTPASRCNAYLAAVPNMQAVARDSAWLDGDMQARYIFAERYCRRQESKDS